MEQEGFDLNAQPHNTKKSAAGKIRSHITTEFCSGSRLRYKYQRRGPWRLETTSIPREVPTSHAVSCVMRLGIRIEPLLFHPQSNLHPRKNKTRAIRAPTMDLTVYRRKNKNSPYAGHYRSTKCPGLGSATVESGDPSSTLIYRFPSDIFIPLDPRQPPPHLSSQKFPRNLSDSRSMAVSQRQSALADARARQLALSPLTSQSPAHFRFEIPLER